MLGMNQNQSRYCSSLIYSSVRVLHAGSKQNDESIAEHLYFYQLESFGKNGVHHSAVYKSSHFLLPGSSF